MSDLTKISNIKALFEENGFTFSKALGQNFIVNPSVCPKIAEMGGAKGAGVIEIGTGIGVLTSELAKVAEKVVAVEIDARLLPILDKTLAEFNNIKIINADVMKTDLKKIISEEFQGMDVVVCANLPYYITSPILMKLLEDRLPVRSITVMVQREAADRICAKLGTREAGAVTVAVNYFSTPTKLFDVSRGSFMPSPNVDSAVIRLDVNDKTPLSPEAEKLFFKAVKAAFGQRRKTLANSLCGGLGKSKDEISQILKKAEIPLNSRAEQLEMDDFLRLSYALSETA